jgi:hypothetical protein
MSSVRVPSRAGQTRVEAMRPLMCPPSENLLDGSSVESGLKIADSMRLVFGQRPSKARSRFDPDVTS